MKKKILYIISQILIYLFSFIYFVLAASFYSLKDPLYWLFVVLALIALFDGLYLSTVKNKETNNVIKYITLGLSIVSPISFVLNIINLFAFKDEEIIFESQKTDEEKVQEIKPLLKRPAFYSLIVGFVMVFVSSISAHAFATSGFTVETTDFVINAEIANPYLSISLNGQAKIIEADDSSWSVTMYKPKDISEGETRPTIFIMPGFTRTKATMAQYAVEYTRRGAVCFIIDPGSQGATTYAGYTDDGGMISSTIGANGLEYLVHYVYKNTERFPFVDRDKIGAIGHSAGGGNVVTLASDYAGSNYNDSVVKSLYISGYIKTSAANKYSSLRCNAVNAYAYYDEGAYRYQSASTALEVVNLRFVNETYGDTRDVSLNDLRYDYAYGDISNGTYRMLHREKTNHAFQMYDKESIANTIAFFRESLSLNTSLSDFDQTWLGKEIFNGIGLLSNFTFVLSSLILLAGLKFVGFDAITNQKMTRGEIEETVIKEEIALDETPQKKTLIPKRGSFASKAIFYGTMILSAVIACLDFIPLARASISLFPDAASNTYTFFFPARMMNAILLWAVVNGLVGFVIFIGTTLIENLVEYIGAKVSNREPQYDFSKLNIFKIGWKDLIRTFIYAIVSFALFYGMVHLSYALFHEDFRFMLISSSPIQPRYFVTWLIYFPLFFIFYLSNSVRVNGSIAKEGLKEWQVYLVSGIANSIGLVFILIINYVTFFKNGTVFYGYWGNPQEEVWLYINMVFALIPLMFVLPLLNRLIYKKTGNAYLGALLICMIFIMMSLSASVSYIPM